MTAADLKKMTTNDLQGVFDRPPVSDRLAELGLAVRVLNPAQAHVSVVDPEKFLLYAIPELLTMERPA